MDTGSDGRRPRSDSLVTRLQIDELVGNTFLDGEGTVDGLPWSSRAKWGRWTFAVARSPDAEAWRVAWAPLGDGTRYEWDEHAGRSR